MLYHCQQDPSQPAMKDLKQVGTVQGVGPNGDTYPLRDQRILDCFYLHITHGLSRKRRRTSVQSGKLTSTLSCSSKDF